MSNINEISISLKIDESTVEKISNDWQYFDALPINIFLSKLSNFSGEFIGWSGEFALPKTLPFLKNKYVISFHFQIANINFYGTTQSLSEAIVQIDKKMLTYHGDGKVLIK